MKTVRKLRDAGLCLLVGLAFVMSAFVHHPALANSTDRMGAAADLSGYVLPDGSLPVICFDFTDQDGNSDSDRVHCPFCTLSKTIALPGRTVHLLATPLPQLVAVSPHCDPILPVLREPGLWSRGPPQTA